MFQSNTRRRDTVVAETALMLKPNNRFCNFNELGRLVAKDRGFAFDRNPSTAGRGHSLLDFDAN